MIRFIIALVLAGWLGWTAISIQRGENEYAITNDATALQVELLERGNIKRLMAGDIDYLGLRDVNATLRFYLAVYRETAAGAVSSEFADSYAKDFCGYVANPNISKAWQDLVKTKFVGDAHLEMRREWCGALG